MDTRTKEEALRAYFNAVSVVDPLRAQFWNERDLTVTQVRLLFLLMRHDGQTMTELAEQFGVAQPTMTRIADRGARDHLVVRAEDPRDRRLVRLFITREGVRAAGAVETAARAFMERIFERMGEDRTAGFIRALRDFRDASTEAVASVELRA